MKKPKRIYFSPAAKRRAYRYPRRPAWCSSVHVAMRQLGLAASGAAQAFRNLAAAQIRPRRPIELQPHPGEFVVHRDGRAYGPGLLHHPGVRRMLDQIRILRPLPLLVPHPDVKNGTPALHRFQVQQLQGYNRAGFYLDDAKEASCHIYQALGVPLPPFKVELVHGPIPE
jgi:hypothetical protein